MFTPEEVHTLTRYRLEEPAAGVDGDAAVSSLFTGVGGLLATIERLRSVQVVDPRQPRLAQLPKLESAVARRYAGGGFGGRVRMVGAMGVAGRVPLPPKTMADMMMNAAVEKQVLAANVFRHVGADYVLPGARRHRYHVEFHRIGEALWVYNLRFTFAAERRDLADGRVLLRYDPRTVPKPEHVTLWRGGCLLEPDGAGGSRISEVLILGTDISLPPFLVGAMRNMVRKKLADRAKNLWVRAWQGR